MAYLHEKINARFQALKKFDNSTGSRLHIQSDSIDWLTSGTIANKDRETAHKGIFNFYIISVLYSGATKRQHIIKSTI